MNDSTSDLTDDQLAAAAYEAWDRANLCLGGGSPMRRAATPADLHALRAVADLARQGWAPVGTGPSLEDLGPLIAWLGEAAMQAADAGRSDDAGKLTWALQIVGERVDEDAPDHVANSSSSLSREIWDLISESDGVYGLHKNGDPAPWDELLPGGEYERLSSLPSFDNRVPDHIAGGSNMVAPPALPSDIKQALIAASDALTDIAEGQAFKVLLPLEWAQGRAFRVLERIRPVMRRFEVRTSEPPAVPPAVKDSLTTAPAPAPLAESDAGDETGRILRLAEIIREVDGNHDKGAAALAEAILSHPGIRSTGLDAAPGPSLDELDRLCEKHKFHYEDDYSLQCLLNIVRDAIVRWSGLAAPPVDGEVAELVEWLNSTGELAGSADIEESKRYWRASELLQQRHPAPVAVSERPWDRQLGWLASDGECWWCPPEGPAY